MVVLEMAVKTCFFVLGDLYSFFSLGLLEQVAALRSFIQKSLLLTDYGRLGKWSYAEILILNGFYLNY